MPRKRSGETIRVTLDMTPEFYERFEELEQLVEAQSKASLLRQALRLYEYMVKRTLEGCTFQVTPTQGEPQSIVFLGADLPQR